MYDVFKDVDYCYAELNNARKIISNQATTNKQYNEIIKMLVIMAGFCDESIVNTVMAHISDAMYRMTYKNILKDGKE